MTLTPRIQQAINKASLLHKNQVRYDAEGTPHISHLISVALLATEENPSEDIFIAALLHDIVEDNVGYDFTHLKEEFGEKIHDMVYALSEDTSVIDWKERKENYLEKLKNSTSDVVLISLADKVHNFDSMIAMYTSPHKVLWGGYFESFKNKIDYYRRLYEVFKTKLGDHKLVKRLGDQLHYVEEEIVAKN